jgi:NCAIR mutase (PurE)-related protein
MDTDVLRDILEKVKEGRVAVDEGMALLKSHFYLDVGCAKIDTHREWRVGYPEVIFCSGKTVEQVKAIVKAMLEREVNILATRASEDLFEEIRKICPDAVYSSLARAFTIRRKALEVSSGYIALVTAGTSDLPVAEEAAVTAELFGNRVERIVDVGVAGIHRLFYNLEAIRGARVVIVVAGIWKGHCPASWGGWSTSPSLPSQRVSDTGRASMVFRASGHAEQLRQWGLCRQYRQRIRRRISRRHDQQTLDRQSLKISSVVFPERGYHEVLYRQVG